MAHFRSLLSVVCVPEPRAIASSAKSPTHNRKITNQAHSSGVEMAAEKPPESREVVTFSCGNKDLVCCAATGATGVIMNLLKSREAADVDTSVETAVEGEIREFVRRDFASVRRQPENDGE